MATRIRPTSRPKITTCGCSAWLGRTLGSHKPVSTRADQPQPAILPEDGEVPLPEDGEGPAVPRKEADPVSGNDVERAARRDADDHAHGLVRPGRLGQRGRGKRQGACGNEQATTIDHGRGILRFVPCRALSRFGRASAVETT